MRCIEQQVDAKTGLIDYDQMEGNALLFRPKVIVAGTVTELFTVSFLFQQKPLIQQIGFKY